MIAILSKIFSGIFWLLDAFIKVLDVLFPLLAAVVGGGLGWFVLGEMDVSTLVRIAGTIGIALASAAVVWLLWKLLKLGGGDF